MKFTSEVKFDDKALKQYISRLKKMEAYEVEYGYYAEDKHPQSGDPMSKVAITNEEGLGVIRRPFMHFTNTSMVIHYRRDKKWQDDVNMYLENGGRIDTLYKKFGQEGKRQVKAVIEAGQFEVTSNPTPLDDTGYMKNNAKVKVVKKGGSVEN